MKERPLICSAWEVQAILAGRKTQLMRPMKPQPKEGERLIWCPDVESELALELPSGRMKEVRSPLGVPGDRVWIKETWSTMKGNGIQYVYAADVPILDRDYCNEIGLLWRSSVHMPRHACRLVVEIEEVSVCRVQETSEADAIAEGLQTGQIVRGGDVRCGMRTIWYFGTSEGFDPHEAFEMLWDARYAKQGYPFAGNPWAWKYKVRVI